MNKTITIYDAKTNFSRLVARAKNGERVVIGTYGKPEVMLVRYEKKNALKIGVWDKKGLIFGDDIVSSDPEVTEMFTRSAMRPVTK